ncbi:MAG: ornithine carbamoyltransferase [Phycisphaerales bacterium]
MARPVDFSILEGLKGRSILRLTDLSAGEIAALLALARALKADYAAFQGALAQRALVMLFEKPSLRTRVSFEIGFQKLGGCVSFLDHRNERIGAREPVGDYGRNLERWADAIVARVFAHDTLTALRANCRVPIVNALSEIAHPCQALADAQTLVEHGIALERCHLAWLGDGNNVCLSLMELAALMGGRMTVVTPPSHRPCPVLTAEIEAIAAKTGASIVLADDPAAIRGADAVYTDAWISMGQQDCPEKIASLRRLAVTPEVMAIAGPRAKFMHCLPAHRGEEVVDAVIDGTNSVIYDQAENRMHAQNALLLALLGALPPNGSARPVRREPATTNA